MKIAMLHYHLDHGGVASVIARHLQAIEEIWPAGEPLELAVLFGGRSQGLAEEIPTLIPGRSVHQIEVPRLEYDANPLPCASGLAADLREVLAGLEFGPSETILHVHNHALGKNVSLPGALAELTRHGYPLLLQIHDFAEDFRPQSYELLVSSLANGQPDLLPAALYPQAAQIHYAVLNRRDYGILLCSGFEASNLHFLPNPIPEIGSLPSKQDSRSRVQDCFGIEPGTLLVLSPVRGISRKNIGETLLWSALFRNRDVTFGFTLRPANPVEERGYFIWRRLADHLGLRCVFEMGETRQLRLQDNFSAADFLISTSLAEGFGLIFLESSLLKKPLLGRDIPEITRDFRAAGMRFDDMHPELAVPIDWLGEEECLERFEAAYTKARESYGYTGALPERVRRQMEDILGGSTIDFARLDVELQSQVVGSVLSERRLRDRIFQLNPWLDGVFTIDGERIGTIAHNASIVQEQFSLASFGRRLLDCYRQVSASERQDSTRGPRNGEKILEAFLDPSRFHPIRLLP